MELDNLGKRCIQKEFKCLSCFRIFKKLVQIDIQYILCPFCDSDNCKSIINENDKNIDNNNESDNYSLKKELNLKNEDNKSENNINKNNNLSNEKYTNLFLNKKKLLENITPFSVSPFAKSVHRHKFDVSDIVDDGILTTVTEDFFLDNYSSNFVSNFDNPLGRMIFIQMQINNNSKIKSIPSLTIKEIRQVQKFEMSMKYCKLNQNEKNDYEFPNCILCLKDILLETNCFLLRCGHLLHDKCFYDWVKEHKICPVCKFTIIKRGTIRKSSIDLIIDDTIKEEEQIEKIIQSPHINNSDKKTTDDIVQLIDNENYNINVIGEKKDEMELLFEDIII